MSAAPFEEALQDSEAVYASQGRVDALLALLSPSLRATGVQLDAIKAFERKARLPSSFSPAWK